MANRIGLVAAAAACVVSTLALCGQAKADILAGSIWPNGTLENASISQANAPSMNNTPGGAGTWRRGGADFGDPSNPGPYTVDFWDNSHGVVSGTHALVLNDNGTNFGEWFVPAFDADNTFVPVPDGATLRFRFFWNFNTAAPQGIGADMRVTIRGTDGVGEFGLGPNFDFLANGTTNNQFVEADFTRTLPAGVTGIRMNIASGGNEAVTGFLAVDDISVVVVPEPATLSVAAFGLAGLLVRRRRA
jgi:hypothetical protein